MKRYLILIGSVLGIIINAIFSIVTLIYVLFVLPFFFSITIKTIITMLMFVFSVVTLILNSLSFITFSYTQEKFNKRYGVLISNIVFNCLLASFASFYLVEDTIILFLIVVISSIATSVLITVDLCLEKTRK